MMNPMFHAGQPNLALCLLLAFAAPVFAEDASKSNAEPTVLARLAASMKPGTWAVVPTEGPDDLIKAPPPSKGLDIMTWCDDGHWDSRSGQFLFMGLRQSRRFIAYSQKTNAWRDVGLPADHAAAGSPPQLSRFGHVYSRNALDPQLSQYYHMDHNDGGGIHRYDLRTEKWTKLPPGGNYAMTGVIEYFSARKGLVNLANGKQGILFFSEETQKWENLGPVPVHGYHSLGRHNPFREEVLLAGGNESPRVVVILKKDGPAQRMKDAPFDLTIRQAIITVDPVSGRYLLMDPPSKKLYEFDSKTDAYRLIDDFTTTAWPFQSYDAPVAAFIPEHGVTMWVARKTYLYKHGQ